MDFFKKLIAAFAEDGVSPALAAAYLIVSALVIIMAVVALIMWISVIVRYMSTNKKTLQSGESSFNAARKMLNKSGLGNIEVKTAGFFRAWIYGNYYDMKRKTIYLRRNISDKNSITAVGLALQKVGVAKLCEEGDAKAVTRYKMKKLGIFGPLFFLPIILIGAIVDIVAFSGTGTFSVIGIILGLVLLIAGFVETLLSIPVEKKANEMALEMIDECGYMTEDERASLKKVFDTYITAYVCDFIVTVLRIIQLVLEVLIKMQKK